MNFLSIVPFLLLFLLICSTEVAFGQNIEPPPASPAPPTLSPYSPPPPRYPYPPIPREVTRKTRPNAIYGDLLGRGLIYAVGFDHLFVPYLGMGASFSYIASGAIFSPYLNLYPIGGYRSSLLIQAGVQFVYIGDKNSELYKGLLWEGIEGLDVGGQIAIGYEYRKGFLFRVILIGMFNKEKMIPWPGLTFGGAF